VTSIQFSELELLQRFEYSDGEKRTLIEVGAHVGFFSKLFAEKGWRVIAFELEPKNYQELCVNLKNYLNVTCIRKAVLDKTESDISFYISPEHWGIHSLKPFHITHQTATQVDTIR